MFVVFTHTSWFADIENYLPIGKVPNHLPSYQKRKIVQQSASYSWADGHIFRIDSNLFIGICVRGDEIHDILQAFHDGPCGGHFADKRTDYKVLNTNYYCPTLFKDASSYVRSCEGCQRMGKPTSANQMPLQT